MTVHVQDRLSELNVYVEELANLSALDRPTKTQNMRMTSLMSIISAIKAGTPVSEIKKWELEQLRLATGLPRLPDAPRTKLGAEVEAEWRKFAKGLPFRETFIPNPGEIRANLAGSQQISFSTPTVGGYFTRQGMTDDFLETMRLQDQIFELWASHRLESSNGSLLAVPVADDVANQSVQVSEAAQSTEVDVFNFSQVQLNSYAFRSKIVAVSLELLEDSNFAIGAALERVFSIRHALGVGNAWMRGSGVAACTGLLTATVASGASATIAAGSAANDGSGSTGSNSTGTADIIN